MSLDYLVLPRLHVRGANMLNALFLVGGPPVLPAYFMAHALGRALAKNDRLATAQDVRSVALVLHQYTPLGEDFEGIFNPQLRRGASLTFGPSQNSSDYSSKNKHALSLQPVACANLTVSLVIGVKNLPSTNGITAFLEGGRLAGGVIFKAGSPGIYGDAESAFSSISNGFVVMDRRDLMEGYPAAQRAERFVEILGRKPGKGEDASWLAATCVGYAAISDFAHRAGAREAYEHAFAEPLVGVVQYVSLRHCLEEERAREALWRPEWCSDDVFRLYQQQS